MASERRTAQPISKAAANPPGYPSGTTTESLCAALRCSRAGRGGPGQGMRGKRGVCGFGRVLAGGLSHGMGGWLVAMAGPGQGQLQGCWVCVYGWVGVYVGMSMARALPVTASSSHEQELLLPTTATVRT
jgi:hypothetical protein